MAAEYAHDPEFVALLWGILENPADDAPRGIIADWIQEHGDDDRAEFIRAQLAAPRWRTGWRGTPTGDWVGPGEDHTTPDHVICDYLIRDWCEAGLLDGWGTDGMVAFRRGFVREVRLPVGVFMEKANRLFETFPIERVVLSDREPRFGQISHSWRWYGAAAVWRNQSQFQSEKNWIPLEILGASHVAEPTKGEADSRLSHLCVSYGRRLVGLPPLTG